MSLSSLPWYIRKEIIDLVIQDNPQYISVSKEWLEQVVKYHGNLVFEYEEEPETMKKPKSILTPFFKTVDLQRNVDIDWDIIKGCKHIENVNVDILKQTAKKEEHFKTNLLQLPRLVSLHLSVPKDNNIDITDIIKRNQGSLRSLSLHMQSNIWIPVIADLSLPNLNKLVIHNLNGTFIVQDIVRKMSKLSVLYFYLYMPRFNNTKLPNISEIEMKHSFEENITKIDLSLFPNLKKISVDKKFQFTSVEPSESVEELAIVGQTDYLYSVVCKLFPKLNNLTMSIAFNVSGYDLITFFPHYKHLTTLKMLSWNGYKFPKSLPAGPFLITSLSLVGGFLITNHLLQWLSNSFKLRRLELDSCHIKKEYILEAVPFVSLEIIQILSNTEFIEQYRAVFNQVNYPHIRAIDITEDNRWSASAYSKYDNDSQVSNEETSSSDESDKTTHNSHITSSEIHN